MASQTWTTATTDAKDTTDASVGVGVGGVITINGTTIVQANGGFSLTIEAGVTVKFQDTGSMIRVGFGGAGGTLACTGGQSSKVVLTSSQASPGSGDWQHIDIRQGDAANPVTVTMLHTVVEYGVNGIVNATTDDVGHTVTCTDCLFRHQSESTIVSTVGTANTWTFTRCQFQKCSGDQTSADDLLRAGSTVSMTFSRCTVYIEYTSAHTLKVFFASGTSVITATDCLIEGANDGAGAVNMAEEAASGTVTGSYNWRVIDGVDEDYVAGTGDATTDPLFLDDTCAGGLDLAPDYNTGVSVASSTLGLLGALEPFNTPIGGTGGEAPEGREDSGPPHPPDGQKPLEGTPQRSPVNILEEMGVSGAILGFAGAKQVFRDEMRSRRKIKRWFSGSFQLPSAATEVVQFANITSARMVIVESSVSCTVTLSDSQKVNVDGLALLHIWRNKSVSSFSVVQTRGVTATINWIAAQ